MIVLSKDKPISFLYEEECASGIKKIADKLRALELLGKHLGMFDTKRYGGEDQETAGGVVILPDIMDGEDDA